MSKLTIKDLEFDLASAKLEPFIADDEREPVKDHRFVWGVVLHSKKKTVGGATWIPSFTSERLLETEARELETWQELAGRHGSWEDAGEMGLLYAFSYLPVGNVRWRFDRAESGRLVFILDGQSHFSHPGGYEGLLPVHMEAELEYAPIPMRYDKEATCRKRIATFGIKDPFDFRVDHGISYLVPTNYPNR